jgi:hypothetical protein
MPFRSKAQARKLFAMAERGEISKEKVEEFARATDFSKLPERVGKKKNPGNTEYQKKGRSVEKVKGSDMKRAMKTLGIQGMLKEMGCG